ncbi:AAA family ATPase [Sorangium sp. So ce260]|uniref:AAA family ATPase n=1 Tax=Sorangium sp. So ce260 TaxID=3133291 RepID=UPI003F5FFF12
MSGAIIDFEEERSRHEQLFGREDVLDRLLGWLVGEQALLPGGWVFLLGSPGVGKSAIVNRLLELLPSDTPHHFIRRHTDDWDRPEALVNNLVARVERLFAEQANVDLPLEARLGELLRRVSKRKLTPDGRRLVLVIDGLDEAACDIAGRNLLPRFLPRVVPSGVAILCASRPMYPHADWLAGFDGVHSILDLDEAEWTASNEAACRAYCVQRLHRLSPPLNNADIETVVRNAQGNMVYARWICEWLARQPPARRTTTNISQGLSGLTRQIISELRGLGGARRALILQGLGLTCAAREALPAYVFNELLGGGPMASEGDEFLRATFHLLRNEPAHWHKGEQGYRLYHEHVREVLIGMLGDRAMRDHHLHILRTIAVWPPDEQDQSRRLYTLRHAVAHLIEAGDVSGAQRLCADIRYLDAKCRELDIHSIERDLEAVIGASDGEAAFELTALLAAVRAEASRLSAHRSHGLLPSLLYNRLRCAGWIAERIERMLCFGADLPPLRLLHGVRLGPTPLRTFCDHTKPVVACVVSRDGRHALSASADRTLRFWALLSGEVLATMRGHEDELTDCALTPDGQTAVSTSIDMTARLWDVATGECIGVLVNSNRGATACAISPDGRLLVVGSDDGLLTLWDFSSRQRVAVLAGHSDYVTACLMTRAGQLVSASRDHSVRVWDLASRTCVYVLSSEDDACSPVPRGSEQGWITALSLLPGGEQILAAAGDGTLSRWDLASGERLQCIGAGQGRVDALAILPWGSHLLCGMADGAIAVWDLAVERCVLRLAAHANAVSACASTSDGRRIVSASHDRSARLWELGGPESLVFQDGHTAPVTAIATTADRRLVVSASEDRLLKVWDTATGACRIILEGHSAVVTACAVSGDSRRVLAGALDGGVLLFHLDHDRGQARVETARGHQTHVSGCALLPDGRIVTASKDGSLWIRDQTDLDNPVEFGAHNGPIAGIAVTPDGSRLLSISRDGTAKLWDLSAYRRAPTRVRLAGELLACSLTPDGGRAVLAFADGQIEVRELQGWKCVRRIQAHEQRIFGCTVSPDGARVISASEDGTVRAFSLETGRHLSTLVGTSWFRCVASAPALICAGDQEGNVWMIVDGFAAPGARSRDQDARRQDAPSAEAIALARDRLAWLFDSEATARLVVKDARLDERRLNLTGSALERWGRILDEAIKQGRLVDVVRCALERYPHDDVLLELAEKLGISGH